MKAGLNQNLRKLSASWNEQWQRSLLANHSTGGHVKTKDLLGGVGKDTIWSLRNQKDVSCRILQKVRIDLYAVNLLLVTIYLDLSELTNQEEERVIFRKRKNDCSEHMNSTHSFEAFRIDRKRLGRDRFSVDYSLPACDLEGPVIYSVEQ